MPEIEAGQVRLHYELEGPPGAPVLVFSNSLGTSLGMWDDQRPVFAGRFRTLRYDTRGHGGSSHLPGEYDAAILGRDVLALLDALDLDKVHFVGLSLGGMTGQWLGVHAPDRILSLTLCATACSMGPRETWDERIATVRRQGTEVLAEATIGRWFTESFREREPEVTGRIREMVIAASDEGYAGCAAAVRDVALCDAIRAIACPTLLVAGASDPSTPPARLLELQERIRGSELVVLPGAHLVNIEAAPGFNAALSAFLARQTGIAPPLDPAMLAAGLKNRTDVLGQERVERAFNQADDFSRTFQELMTSYCWGSVWGRPGLDRKTRSLLNLAMLCALNRGEELRLHIGGALRNGVTKEEIMEVFLQVMIYCGVPASVTAFREARAVFEAAEKAG